jgi:Flp pilus assembly protein TadG
MKPLARFRHARLQRGTALIEFALVAPFLIVMSVTVTEFGRAIYEFQTLTRSVREGARYLSLHAPGTHTTEARNVVVYGNTAGTGSALLPRLTLTQVPTPTWQLAGANPQINTVTVQVSGYSFQPMMGSVFGLTFSQINFPAIAASERAPS